MKASIQILDARVQPPAYETPGSAGMDLRAAIDEPVSLPPGGSKLLPAGFSMALPAGHVALLMPRSGLGHKDGIVLGNLVGVIDSDYRGPVMVSVWNRRADQVYTVHPLDRIAQMLIIPVAQVNWKEVDALPATLRGAGGFGSTGK